MSAEGALVIELIRLRRGWGLQNRNLRARLGPQLLRLSAIQDTDGDREIRDKLGRLLRATIESLPPELAHAARVAFALDRAHQHRHLTQRIESLAGEQSWAPRTARRRMDHAVQVIAQVALGELGASTHPRAVAVGGTVLDPTTMTAVLQLDPGPHDAPAHGVTVLRVPVPPDRFELLITFDRTRSV